MDEIVAAIILGICFGFAFLVVIFFLGATFLVDLRLRFGVVSFVSAGLDSFDFSLLFCSMHIFVVLITLKACN